MEKIDFLMNRKLEYEKDGKCFGGEVQIGPVTQDHTGFWACRLSISHIVDGGTAYRGVDPLDAVCRALRAVRYFLDHSEEDGIGTIWWLEKGDHGGF